MRGIEKRENISTNAWLTGANFDDDALLLAMRKNDAQTGPEL